MSGGPALVVLAAGLGRRFGGTKQLADIGPNGEALMDYTIYNAIEAGFERAVFIVRDEIMDAVAEHVADFPLECEFRIQSPVAGVEGRTRPWGTCHAVLAAAGALREPFAIVNADDLYGPQTLELLGDALLGDQPYNCLVGYRLKHTLSKHGEVNRAVCETAADGRLQRIVETLKIPSDPSQMGLTGEELVSMNAFGFLPEILSDLRTAFDEFLAKHATSPDAELQLPDVLDELVQADRRTFQVLPTEDEWVGVTHAEDLEGAQQRIRDLIDAGEYPSPLWE